MTQREPKDTPKRRLLARSRAPLFALALLGILVQLPLAASAIDDEEECNDEEDPDCDEEECEDNPDPTCINGPVVGLGCDPVSGDNGTGVLCHVHAVGTFAQVPIVLPNDPPCWIHVHPSGGFHVHCFE